MKIVNLKRFIIFVVGVVIMVCIFISLFNVKSISRTEVSYTKYTVGTNDSLWKIATIVKENNINYENKDIREIIFEIKKINNLENSNIYEKQIITLPKI